MHQDAPNALSEVTRKRRQEGIRVSAVLRARSRRVAGDLSPWCRKCREVCMVVDQGSSTPKKLYSTLFWPSSLSSKSFIIQVSSFEQVFLWTNPSFLHQSRSLSIILGFSFSVLCPNWKIFSLTISTLYDLSVFFPVPFIGWEVFHQFISCPIFFPSLPYWVGRFFTSDMTLWDSSAFLQG